MHLAANIQSLDKSNGIDSFVKLRLNVTGSTSSCNTRTDSRLTSVAEYLDTLKLNVYAVLIYVLLCVYM